MGVGIVEHMTTMLPFRFEPIDRAAAEALRSAGGVLHVADEAPGYPCRQCLRDAELGEELLLVSHDPFRGDSPYRSASPTFIHRVDCGDPDVSGVPDQLRRRSLSVRAFDAEEMMIGAAVIDGGALADTLVAMFAESTVDRVHVHNSPRGCWATTVVRAG